MAASNSSSGLGSIVHSVIVGWIAPLRAHRPVLLSFLVFLVLAGLVGPLSFDYWTGDPGFLSNVLAEVHGTLLDLLLFGCLLLWFDQTAERRRRIERYENAVDDFRGWATEEAMHRISGNIRRLNREGVAPDTLKNTYLHGADLKGTDLSEASLHGANLSNTTLTGADLSDTYLGSVDLSGANLRKANLSGAHFGVFPGMRASEEGQDTTLAGAYLRGADLRGIRNASAETFAQARTLYKARLDPELEAEIEAQYPALLEPRGSDVPG